MEMFNKVYSGIQIPISNDEVEILEKIKATPDGLEVETLPENEIELVRKMVSRGILNRVSINGSSNYYINDSEF